MAVSNEFIIGLVFNITSLVTSLIAMWQTHKILSIARYRSLNDIEAPSSQAHTRTAERAPSIISTGDEEEGAKCPYRIIVSHPAKLLNSMSGRTSAIQTWIGWWRVPRAVPNL
ncbi:uncharacterized protein APUU_21944S [Aspergillus puulaauensis]|uniref:Uncharacterized protein n=1 Tax=Aspergillus puulaauensis TaxID=1220207 RepID=A0A7R7XHN9_9EURO|nr:uncharacterized protein APUU_21944S [Aspergillus puulaauensis]BCS21512.1 hypothetical protein APUU_21944S [Aspergillus puulaauensis]